MKNLNNVLKFDDFDNNWKAKTQKSTKRTDVGFDVLNERYTELTEGISHLPYDVGIPPVVIKKINEIIRTINLMNTYYNR